MSDQPKGKGKTDEKAGKAKADDSSLASRIADSAAGLAKDIVNTASGSALASSLASTTAGSKAAGSGSSASASTLDRSSSSTRTGPSVPSFRTTSARNQEQTNEAEEDFSAFLDSTPVQSFEPLSVEEYHSQYTHPVQHKPPLQHPAGVEDDGFAVLDLLNNPDMNNMVDTAFQDAPPPAYEPSAAEMGRAPGVTNPQNLLPDAVNTLSAVPPSGMPSNDDHGRFELVKEQQQWVSDWEGVLKNYMRDVWTDLEPLIIEAKKELQSKEEEKPALDHLSHKLHELKSKL